jgi:metal-responsive CopG/Arc/MetJ family transcriptional regulator
MGKAKVKIEKGLYEKVEKFAAMSGYTSPEEFITHLLEKEIAKIEEADSEEEIKKKLKGLGYIS